MCHDPHYVEQLRADLEHFTARADAGDETAVRAAAQTALELESLGVRLTSSASAPETLNS